MVCYDLLFLNNAACNGVNMSVVYLVYCWESVSCVAVYLNLVSVVLLFCFLQYFLSPFF